MLTSPQTTLIASTMSPRELESNRANMTVLHFLITYPKWSMSLFLFLASRSLPLPSVDDAIHQPLRNLGSLWRVESNAYQQCVRRSFQKCAENRHDALMQENTRVMKVRQANQMMWQRANQTNTQCLTATQTTRNALLTWSRVNSRSVPILQIHPRNGSIVSTKTTTTVSATETGICTAGDMGNMTVLLNDGVVAAAKDLSDLNHYVSDSEAFSRRLVQYMHDLAQYNYNYFMAAKIQPVLQLLKKISAPDFHPPTVHLETPGWIDLDARVGLTLQGMQQAMQVAVNEMDILMERLQEFDASITTFHVQYQNLYTRFGQVVRFVQDLSLGLVLPSFFSMDSIPLPDSLLPSHLGIPQFQGGLLQLGDVSYLMKNATQQVVAVVDQVVIDLAGDATKQMGRTEQFLAKQLQAMLTLHDYHPPVFTGLTEEMSKLHEESLQAMGDVHQALDQLWTMTSTDVMDNIPPNSDEMNPNNVTFSTNSTKFDYLTPEFPSLSLPAALIAIAQCFLHYMWLLELLLQGFRLWRLDTKYSRNATPHLPEIDLTGNANHSNESQKGNDRDNPENGFVQRKWKSIQLLGFNVIRRVVCCNFGLILALFVVPLLVGVSSILYPHYRTNCVLSRNGTFVARNVWAPLVVNQANTEGNTVMIMEEVRIDSEKSEICRHNLSETTRFHRSELTQMSQTQRQYNQTLRVVSLVKRCVDVNQLDEMLQKACCGLKGYSSSSCVSLSVQGVGNRDSHNWTCPIDDAASPPGAFLPIRLYNANPSCQQNVSEWVMEDSRFSCQALPGMCNVPCRSVDTELIIRAVIEADCSIEGYYFGCLFLLLVALYHAVLINLWATLLFNGVKNLLWRKINPNILMMKTHIHEDGTLVKDAMFRDSRSELIRAALSRFRLLGFLQLGLGLFIFVGWLVSFSFL